MSLNKKVLIFVCCYLIASILGCTDIVATGVRTVEYWDTKFQKPQANPNPWHFDDAGNVIYDHPQPEKP